jgi:leukotriene-A4 hydrolase
MTRFMGRVWLMAVLMGAGGTGASRGAAERPQDAHSHGNPSEILVNHLDLDLTPDFARKELRGSAVLTVERQPGCPADAPLMLDARGLRIESITGDDGEALQYEPGGDDPVLGRGLRIRLPEGASKVRITYRTAPSATALQWLEPAQTAGGKRPFLFTQSQAIHARTWIPCQDSPGVRVTYSAKVHVPEGLTAVMSADAKGHEGNRFRFDMPQPIPPYLIALAVGELEFRELGKRTGVWAEPPVVAKAAHEFADTEKMLEAAERRFGPYRWGRYDLLVLPPSFPFGGMENAKLTFLTPTVLAGDRSLVSLIAHELAHSWSGNLVTCATWRDFWLNEGFTTYLERRIVEDLYGADRAEIEAVLGLRDLRAELGRLKPRDQVLHVELAGRDPDEAMNPVAYEKGALFLTHLEQVAGRERFDAFLKDYFDRHAFQSITTADFEADVREHLFRAEGANRRALSADLRAWLHNPGIPANAPQPTSARLEKVAERSARWLAGAIDADDLQAGDWSSQEWIFFLNALPDGIPADSLAELDAAYHLTEKANSEVLLPWLRRSIRSGYDAPNERLESFLTSMGRRKYLLPLYEELARTPAGRERAKAIYRKARPLYHPIAAESVDRVLEVR